jgi:hypothetical protein
LRNTEWLFVFFFIASGLYCLAYVAGVVTFQLPLPEWLQSIGSYLSPYKWVFIMIGILVSVGMIWDKRRRK